jgi:type II secretory pathway pseudopilin PulG
MGQEDRVQRRKGTAGVTLVELMIALGVIAVALMGLVSVILHTTKSNAVMRENLVAMRAAEQKIEEMRAVDFYSIFTDYTTVSGGADLRTPTFQVTGLLPVPGATVVGKIIFPSDAYPNPGGTQLLENMTSELMGVPQDMDLNGSSVIESGVNLATIGGPLGAYDMLPVMIQLDWQSIHGRRSLQYRHVILNKSN